MTASPVVLIPARKASTRLPNKLLQAIGDQPLIVHTCQRAAEAYGPERVIVCADHPDLIDAVTGAGFQARMTRPDHASGSERIAEVAAGLDDAVVINVQGDEPEIDPAHIRRVGDLLTGQAWADLATLATPGDAADQADPNAVKVVCDHQGRALIFTRAPCPWDRQAGRPAAACLRHLGIYAYRREVLVGYADLPASALEKSERLEQLRALEAGLAIACAVVDHAPSGVDTPADLAACRARLIATPGNRP